MENLNPNFIMVNNDLLSNSTLSSTQKLFISYILGWQKSSKTCRMTNKNLASHFGLKYAGIRSLLNRLNKYPFFETTQYGHSTENANWTSGHEMKVDEDKLIAFLNSDMSEKQPADVQPIIKESEIIKTEQQPVTIESDKVKTAQKEETQIDEVETIKVEQHPVVVEASETEKIKSKIKILENILANDNHKPAPASEFESKFGLQEKVNLFDITEYAEFGYYDAGDFMEHFDADEVIFEDLISYMIELRDEQNIEDYDSVEISNVHLKNIIQIIQTEESENNSSVKAKAVIKNLEYILANDEHKPAPHVLPTYKININEQVTLLDVIEDIGFDLKDCSYFLDYFDDKEEVVFGDLIDFIIETRNEQNTEGYTSVEITDLILKNLIHMTIEEPIQHPST